MCLKATRCRRCAICSPMQQEKVFELLDLARQNLQEQPSLILNCADEKKSFTFHRLPPSKRRDIT